MMRIALIGAFQLTRYRRGEVLEEFIGTYRVNNLEIQYVKILADSLFEAEEKLSQYLEESKIDWYETEIISNFETIE